jgi:hypothetical protein
VTNSSSNPTKIAPAEQIRAKLNTEDIVTVICRSVPRAMGIAILDVLHDNAAKYVRVTSESFGVGSRVSCDFLVCLSVNQRLKLFDKLIEPMLVERKEMGDANSILL